jgi:bacterioferritin
MLRDSKVIEHLNTQLTNELTAINQYFLHARTLEHWGVTKLGKQEYAESIEEMKHADELIQRILFLDGLPNVQRMNQIAVGETVQEILQADMRLEDKALDDPTRGDCLLRNCARLRLQGPTDAHSRGRRGTR